MLRAALFTVSALLSATAPACALSLDLSFKPPSSWTQTSPDGRFVFAMIDPDPTRDRECFVRSRPTAREDALDLRRRCPRSGMYRTDTGASVWETDEWFGTEPYSGGSLVLVSGDGEHLVWLSAIPAERAERQGTLDRWRNGRRQTFSCVAPLGDLATRRDLPAIRLLSRGRAMTTVAHGDILLDSARYPKSIPFAMSWLESAEIEGRHLVVVTNDDQQLSFDLDSGALLARGPISGATASVRLGVGFAVVLLAALGAARFRRQRLRPQAERD